MYECQSCKRRFPRPNRKSTIKIENGLPVEKDIKIIGCPYCGSSEIEETEMMYDEWYDTYGYERGENDVL